MGENGKFKKPVDPAGELDNVLARSGNRAESAKQKNCPDLKKSVDDSKRNATLTFPLIPGARQQAGSSQSFWDFKFKFKFDADVNTQLCPDKLILESLRLKQRWRPQNPIVGDQVEFFVPGSRRDTDL